ncbi:phosphopantothenoylcysteine decarboxylase subunit VHS3-like [Phalaenopsis equestris]|uniref:phosphopantothenoylcysteine decarboxylase subunit VHS3-like n=1 Tax=Phalaenopsis equestris TaxID=78828 RepID=UPI0009E621CE|nr:phosphopantothenoylcysteine decarboxylase subunit VHS3-like [Phalaenopsis equestris]
MEGEAQILDQESLIQSPLKRKCDLIPDEEGEDERAMKQKKPDDAPVEERVASHDDNKEGANQNGNASKEKGKSILSAADKGKGKMVVDEEEGGDEKRGREFGVSSGDEDGSSEVHGDRDDDDTDFDDDPLAEMDLDNILPVRTRRRSALEPGAYLVEGDDDDDDDDDDDHVEEEEEDEEDEEVDEGEEVEDEDKQEEIK